MKKALFLYTIFFPLVSLLNLSVANDSPINCQRALEISKANYELFRLLAHQIQSSTPPPFSGVTQEAQAILKKWARVLSKMSDKRKAHLLKAIEQPGLRELIWEFATYFPEEALTACMRELDMNKIIAKWLDVGVEERTQIFNALKDYELQNPGSSAVVIRGASKAGPSKQIEKLIKAGINPTDIVKALASPFIRKIPQEAIDSNEVLLHTGALLAGTGNEADIKWLLNPPKEAATIFQKNPEFKIALAMSQSQEIEGLSPDHVLLKMNGQEIILDVSNKKSPKLQKIQDSKIKVEKLRQLRAESNLKLKVDVSFPEMQALLDQSNDKAMLITTGKHTGLLINGNVYDIVGGGDVRKTPFPLWSEHWNTGTLVASEFEATPLQVRKLQQTLEDDLQKTIPYSLFPVKPKTRNCALLVSSYLKEAQMFDFGSRHLCKFSPGDQAAYMATKGPADPRVRKVYIRSGSTPQGATKQYGLKAVGGAIVAGVLIESGIWAFGGDD